MARVRYIEEETSDNPVVKEAFERMRLKRGKVTNIYKALAHKPSILAALRYAEALTLHPGDIPEGVFTELGKYFSESQIVEITMVAALYNMVNRFNEALKLDPEEY